MESLESVYSGEMELSLAFLHFTQRIKKRECEGRGDEAISSLKRGGLDKLIVFG